MSFTLLLASPASADNPKINTQTFRPSPHGSDLFATVTSDVPDAWTWSAAAWLSYGMNPLVFVDLAEVAPDFEAIQHQLALHATGALAFTDWLSVGLEVPVFLYNGGESSGFVPIEPIASTALGDIRLSAKLGILRRDKDADGFGLGLELPFGLPTGDRSAFVSDGFTFVPALVLDVRFAPVQIAVNIGARIRDDEQLAPGTDTGPEAVFRIAAAVDVVPAFAILGEIQGASHNFELSNNTYVEGLIGGRLDLGDGFHVTLAGGRAFTTGYGSTAARVVAQLGFTPEPAPIIIDTDGDGLFDDVDRCVTDPEDKDGWQDEDGCPDPDNDMDGILDTAERCEGEVEDIDGFEDHDGCIDPDNDKDGIRDDVDGEGGRCKDVAEDMDGFQDSDGCPDADNDADGILDIEDGCPNDATGRCGVVIDPCELRILDQVNFGYDDAVIQVDSFRILDAITAVLNAQPALKLIEVQGHTDGDGDAAYNLELSQKRAAAVVAYLTGKGIAPTRLVAKGYGETVPLDTNKTAAGRAKNRRVQFIILDPVQSGCGR